MKPEVTIRDAVLFISNTSTEFPRTHGARVKAVGGRYSDIRGNGASHRYVTLPFSERALLDEIMETYSGGPKRVVQVVSVESRVLGRERCHAVVNQNNLSNSFVWDPKSGRKPSDFLEEEYEKRLSDWNWEPVMTRWDKEDRDALARRLEAERNARIASLREMIAYESVRILDGTNDIEPLKALAAEYREACREAGIALDGVAEENRHEAVPMSGRPA